MASREIVLLLVMVWTVLQVGVFAVASQGEDNSGAGEDKCLPYDATPVQIFERGCKVLQGALPE